MKPISVFTILTLASLFTACNIPEKVTNLNLSTASAQEMKDVTGMTPQQHIDMITKNKGQFGSADTMRRFFFGDLEPIGIQPGGAGMVVNLYNKKNNVTFSYCSTYDVVVAVKKGKVTKFSPEEVK
jgi:thiamine pyrophosphokinase